MGSYLLGVWDYVRVGANSPALLFSLHVECANEIMMRDYEIHLIRHSRADGETCLYCGGV